MSRKYQIEIIPICVVLVIVAFIAFMIITTMNRDSGIRDCIKAGKSPAECHDAFKL